MPINAPLVSPFAPRSIPNLLQEYLNRIAAGLFARPAGAAAGDRTDAAAAERGERLSVAAVRLAFCSHAATRRWLVHQEGLLLAARIRLGERSIPPPPPPLQTNQRQPNAGGLGSIPDGGGIGGDGSASAVTRTSVVYANQSRAQPPPPLEGHRWVEFERAFSLIRGREVTLFEGWAAVPDDLMYHVEVADQSSALSDELEATWRRLEHMRVTPGSAAKGAVSPGLMPLLAQLALWRPEPDEYLNRRSNSRVYDGGMRWPGNASEGGSSGGGGGGGGEGKGVDSTGGGQDGGALRCGGADSGLPYGPRRGWRRGWRKDKRRLGQRGGAASGPPSSLPTPGVAGSAVGAALAAPPALGMQTAFGRLPTGPFFTALGVDAKRVLRVLRKGGAAASTGPTARPFPLCMRRHLAGLQSNHHLRHHARHQLTLFFKAGATVHFASRREKPVDPLSTTR